MRKMKALFICENILVLKEKILPSLMFITNKGYSVDIVANEVIDIAFVEKVYTLDFPEKMSYFKSLKFASKLKEILKSEEYDVIQTFDNMSSFLLENALYEPFMSNLNIYADNLKKSYSKLAKVIKKSDNLIVNNEEDFEIAKSKKCTENISLIHDLGLDFRKYSLVDFGILKAEIRNKYKLEESKKYVALLDIYDKENYVAKVIEEIAMQNSNITFVVKNLDSKLRDILEKNNLLSSVMCLENIKWVELLVVCDSAFFGNVASYDLLIFIYALMIAVPVISEKNNTTEMYIQDSKNGFLVSKGDVQQAAVAIGRSLNIPKTKLDELSAFNYEIINKFSIDKYVYKLNELYKEIKEVASKDVYLIEDLKKRKDTEKLMEDIKENGAIGAEIITINSSVNDEKMIKVGASIKTFDISTFNGRYKFKRYINKVLKENRFTSLKVYGNMFKILDRNKIYINSENLIANYVKI
ncbi:MAG: glycosyltransferase [Clostridia bacterium]|nr:glycosyltransferase [Clostridia bacterium]